jgi:hypothetical protein
MLLREIVVDKRVMKKRLSDSNIRYNLQNDTSLTDILSTTSGEK